MFINAFLTGALSLFSLPSSPSPSLIPRQEPGSNCDAATRCATDCWSNWAVNATSLCGGGDTCPGSENPPPCQCTLTSQPFCTCTANTCSTLLTPCVNSCIAMWGSCGQAGIPGGEEVFNPQTDCQGLCNTTCPILSSSMPSSMPLSSSSVSSSSSVPSSMPTSFMPTSSSHTTSRTTTTKPSSTIPSSTTSMSTTMATSTSSTTTSTSTSLASTPTPTVLGPMAPVQLFSSGSSTCGNDSLEIDVFQSYFTMSTAGVQLDMEVGGIAHVPNLDVNFQINFTANGETFQSMAYDFCVLAGMPMPCALPQNGFAYVINITFDEAFSAQIPSSVWTSPNLDMSAHIVFIDRSDNTQVACIDTVLWSPITIEQTSVSWVTGVITFGAIIVGAIGSLLGFHTVHSFATRPTSDLSTPSSGPKKVWTTVANMAQATDPINLLMHFQFISNTGLLSLQYPAIYSAFTLNFAWANLILPVGNFRQASDQMRLITGGCPARTFQGDIASLNVPEVSSEPADYDSGIAFVSNHFGVSNATLGGLVYLSILLAVAVAIFIFAIVAVLLLIYRATKHQDHGSRDKARGYQVRWNAIASNNSLRLFMWILGTLATFAFYQFTQRCSGWLPIFLSAIEFSIIFLTIAIVSVLVVVVARLHGTEKLFAEKGTYMSRWGALYDDLKLATFFWFIPLFVSVLCRSAIISFGQNHGLVQVILLTLLELALFIALSILRPYRTLFSNAHEITGTGQRVLANLQLLVYVAQINVSIPGKRIAGLVLIAFECIVALLLIVLLLIKLVICIRNKLKARKNAQQGTAPAAAPGSLPSNYEMDPFLPVTPGESDKDVPTTAWDPSTQYDAEARPMMSQVEPVHYTADSPHSGLQPSRLEPVRRPVDG